MTIGKVIESFQGQYYRVKVNTKELLLMLVP